MAQAATGTVASRMSLRLSTLNPDEPRAEKDCRVCNRRRVRCDRSLPSCRKCALKNLQCSGYSVRLQWGQGIASRGKLRGKATPAEDDSSGAVLDLPVYRFVKSSQLPRTCGGERITASSMELLQYYESTVAGLMPWIDDADNQWRTVLIPLSQDCASLFHAILALAAEHRNHSQKQLLSCAARNLANYHREKCLQLLAQDLRTELAQEAQSLQHRDTSGVLAAILVLCNVEMIRFDPNLWNIHWGAARTIVERWTTGFGSDSVTLDEKRQFLLKTVFDHDVFAASTNFNDYPALPTSVVQFASSDFFVRYMMTVQDITFAERQSTYIGLEDLRARFEAARSDSKAATEERSGFSHVEREEIKMLVDCYHYAGLLYGLQVASHAIDTSELRQHCAEEFLAVTSRMQVPGPLGHDPVWPLFIAGTEARQHPKLQALVDSLLPAIMQRTGFNNCQPALDFLRRFWITDAHAAPNWLSYARQDAQRDSVFFVI